jgi:hypothetical protein
VGDVNQPPSFALKAAYYCVAEVMRNRKRTGQPIPSWLRQHYDQLDEQFRSTASNDAVERSRRIVASLSPVADPIARVDILSRSRHEFDCGGEQSEPADWITAKGAALMLGCSKRTVQRNAADFDGRLIGGRLLFELATVAEYAESKQHA